MDIDKGLIEQARKNLRIYASCTRPDGQQDFPRNLPMVFGPLEAPGGGGTDDDANEDNSDDDPFPKNVRFICGNYVLDADDLLETIQPEFDTVICLSTTKWMQLNFGDDGLKRAFKRMYAQLRPGGLLILEAQDYHSYAKKKKLTERIFENFQNIKLRPEHFADYLIHVVGFEGGRLVAVPHHSSQGFQRPIQVFYKRQLSCSSRSASSRGQNTPFELGPSPFPFVPGAGSSSYHGPNSSYHGHPSPGYHLKNCYAPLLTPQYKPSPSPLHSSSTPPQQQQQQPPQQQQQQRPIQQWQRNKERPVAIVKPQPGEARRRASPIPEGDEEEEEDNSDRNDDDDDDSSSSSSSDDDDQNQEGEEAAGGGGIGGGGEVASPSYPPSPSFYPRQDEADEEEEEEQIQDGEGAAREDSNPNYADGYMGATPNYSPGEAPSYSGYSGYTPGRSGITPGYSGPSPDHLNDLGGGGAGGGPHHSPVYSGPEPGAFGSNASTPGHPGGGAAGYTPTYSPSYTPSNPGTPLYNPGTPTYSPTYSPGPGSPAYINPAGGGLSPGNATPQGGHTPSTPKGPSSASSSPSASSPSPAAAQAGSGGSGSATPPPGPSGMQQQQQNRLRQSPSSPQIQQPEISGNTTPHPGIGSSRSPASNAALGSPKYFWYGAQGGANGGASDRDHDGGDQDESVDSPPIANSGSSPLPSPPTSTS